MDNNKNKQFFWQVKDFLSKKPTPAPSVPQNGLKSTINSVINSPINYNLNIKNLKLILI